MSAEKGANDSVIWGSSILNDDRTIEILPSCIEGGNNTETVCNTQFQFHDSTIIGINFAKSLSTIKA